MSIDDLTRRLMDEFPEWDRATAAHTARTIDGVAMEASVERDLAALPTFGMEDGMTLSERLSTRSLAVMIAEKDMQLDAKDNQIAQLLSMVETYELIVAKNAQTIEMLDKSIAKKEEDIFALLSSLEQKQQRINALAELVAVKDIPKLDESWRA